MLHVTILAAGRGTRLGMPDPKPLTHLGDGRTIMQQQMQNLNTAYGSDFRPILVVGFRFYRVVESFPDTLFVYNEEFETTNTSKSLLRALRVHAPGGVLWMNGDVVFDPALLELLRPYIESDTSVVSVNRSKVSDEEVKYTVDAEGFIKELSKTVVGGLGEAVGINYVSSTDRQLLLAELETVDDQDYFERGIELAIAGGARFVPVDIGQTMAVEIDFPEDLERANDELRNRA